MQIRVLESRFFFAIVVALAVAAVIVSRFLGS